MEGAARLPDGASELIVHRKGATPAGAGVLGIIPGSMATPGYVVRGKGSAASLQVRGARRRPGDEPHGGEGEFHWTDTQRILRERGVTLLSAGLDEVPMVYKDIDAGDGGAARSGGAAGALRSADREDGPERRAGGLTRA